MKFWLLSDLHIDVAPYIPAPTPDGAEAIIVAGDICSKLCKRSLPWLRANLADRGLPVVFVPGNHDFYATNLTTEIDKARILARQMGIHLLVRGESIVLSGTRFIGGTLWTDYWLGGQPVIARQEAMQRMNCHRRIRYCAEYRRFGPNEAASEHQACLRGIEAELARPFQSATVVVTHHAPTALSLETGNPSKSIDASYASDLGWMMERYRPDIWVHGHIHQNHDFDLHGTRILSNPRGYVIAARMGRESASRWRTRGTTRRSWSTGHGRKRSARPDIGKKDAFNQKIGAEEARFLILPLVRENRFRRN